MKIMRFLNKSEFFCIFIGTIIGASLTYSYISYQHNKSKKLKTKPKKQNKINYNILQDNIVREQLTRNIQFFGESSQSKISNAFVIIIGLGGVGSHAANLLLRSGIKKLRLVDFDQVSLSSLNRHAVATREDVGIPKTTCLQSYFKKIMPEAIIEIKNMIYNEKTENEILSDNPDFVLDAIDNIDTKAALLYACKKRNIPVLCAAGAGAKADPTKIRFSDLSESTVDPLAKAVRLKLKQKYNITKDITFLISTEKPRCELLPTETDKPWECQIVPNFRVRIIPVLGTSPATFGMAAASYILCNLANQMYIYEPIFKIDKNQYRIQLERLIQREENVYGNISGVEIDLEDVVFIVKYIWRGMSAWEYFNGCIHNKRNLKRDVSHLMLVRWNVDFVASLDNLIMLNFDECEIHEKKNLDVIKNENIDFYNFVENKLNIVRHYYQLI